MSKYIPKVGPDGNTWFVPAKEQRHPDFEAAREKWLLAVLATGLKHLFVLGLPGHPPAKAIAVVAKAWRMVLLNQHIDWNPDQDAARIDAAFLKLMEFTKWPSPGDLLAAMEPRQAPLALPPAMETPARREQRRQSTLTGIRSVLETMNLLPKES